MMSAGFFNGKIPYLDPAVYRNMELNERARLTDDDIAGLDMAAYRKLKKDSLTGAFKGCAGLISPDLSGLKTNGVKSMDHMFEGCRKLRSLDLSGFDTSEVRSMPYMFSGCWNLRSLNLSSFDFSKVTDMYRMFFDCAWLRELIVSDTIGEAKVITRSTGHYEWNSTWGGAHSPSQADFAGTLERVWVGDKETIALGDAKRDEQFAYLGLRDRVELVVVPHKRR